MLTEAEQGFLGFEMTQWYGLLAPASLPQPALDKLAAAAASAVKQPGAAEKLSADSAIAIGGTPAEFAEVHRHRAAAREDHGDRA